MGQNIIHISILVKDYDEAIEFYTNKLNFELVEDTRISDSKRWVLVKPKREWRVLFAFIKAVTDEQKEFIGNQSGDRVFLFLSTEDFEKDYSNLIEKDVTIVRKPTTESYGRVAVFMDLYGNKWDLIESK